MDLNVRGIIVATLIGMILFTGCSKEEKQVLYDDPNYTGEVLSIKIPLGLSREEFETVINELADYKVCQMEIQKQLTYPDAYSDELIEDMKLKHIKYYTDPCPEDCEAYEELGQCSHMSALNTVSDDVDQYQSAIWYGFGKQLKDLTLHINTYSVFPKSDHEVIIVLKYYDESNNLLFTVGEYDSSLGKFTSIS